MNIGQLNKRITIQRSGDVVDERNVTTSVFTDLTTCWAKVNNLFGKEYWSALEHSAQSTVEFTIRYSSCKDISILDRIVFKGKYYNISFVDNVLYKNNYLIIKAMEVS